jgi:hypothetical protein
VQIIRVVNWFQIGICSDVTTNLLIFVKREEINEEKIALGGSFFSSCWQIEKLNWKLVYFTRPFKGEIFLSWKITHRPCFHLTQTHAHDDDDCERNDFNFWCLLAFLVSSSSININPVPVVVLSRHSLHSITLRHLSLTSYLFTKCYLGTRMVKMGKVMRIFLKIEWKLFKIVTVLYLLNLW